MFALTGDVVAAAPLFAHVATLLGGRDPRALVRTADAQALHHNRNGQILCALAALAACTALADFLPAQRIAAGYSVGEVAAWSVAGAFGRIDTLDLVARRAALMDAASTPGDGLVYLRGLPRDVVEALARRAGAAIAITNPGDRYVIGGTRSALDAVRSGALAMKAAQVLPLPVEVAAHTGRLAGATSAFRVVLNEYPSRLPPASVRLLSGIDAAPVLDLTDGLDKLAAQISQTVSWAACLRACVEAGATAFLELGPGHALSDMTRSALPSLRSRCLEDFATMEGVERWIAEVA
ncbi:putative malonyl CoA-acyl carrier protein transacylase [Stappia sp. 22II-S9-Z10]|nr:putative malonyl CoA-acyl carrier protein transacylase [Stappia sp. 22II-S9-Z10]